MSAPNPERSCIGCKHWSFHPGTPDWSEVTPGDDWSATCLVPDRKHPSGTRSHWQLSGRDVDASEWYETMQKAKDCTDYKPRPGAPK